MGGVNDLHCSDNRDLDNQGSTVLCIVAMPPIGLSDYYP